MLRVLQIGPLPPPWGGVQTNLAGIQAYLIRKGHRAAGLNVTRHRGSSSDRAFYPNSAGEVLRLLWTLPYDILHLHVGGDFLPRIVGLCLAVTSVPGKRSVLSFHSGGYPSSEEGQRAHKRSVRGFALRRFDRIVVVNQELREVFLRYGVGPQKCRLILPYWVPDQAPDLEDGPIKSFFARHRKVIVSVGLLEPEYDLPLQLSTFAHLAGHELGLLWIGSGSLEPELRRLIEGSPAREHILLCGDVPRPQTLASIARAALLWRTTLFDGDAVSVREALHFGTPALATNNGMRPPGVHLTPISDSQNLFMNTKRLLSEPRPPRQLQNGEANLQAMLELYEEIALPG